MLLGRAIFNSISLFPNKSTVFRIKLQKGKSRG